MFRIAVPLLFVACAATTLWGQGGSRVLPSGWTYRSDIQSPSEFAGFPFGSRHWPHHRVVEYMKYLAEKSERATWEPYAKSHGGRELGFLTITSPSNRERLEEIRKSHRRLAHPKLGPQVKIDGLPVVIQMGYGVHGDESSATHASVPVAYLLCAGLGDEVDQWLDQMVIRLDPSLNPDGFQRFSHWVNQHRGRFPSADSNDREHRQPWPGGRVNYYWFDLNRDWLPAVHPESRGRLREYHRWKPNVVLDFHEMGTSSTYFFQPGVPKRTNPLSPQRTRDLTRQFADYHATALDEIDSLYFTEERFDDFYPGKGSTYPDLHGAVGILFEQGSARGNIQNSRNGPVLFWKTIRNQVTTSLSSLRATSDLRQELLDNMRQSYVDAAAMAADQEVRAYAFAAQGDLPRLRKFAELLGRHDLHTQWHVEPMTGQSIDGEAIELPAWTLVVPTDQPEYRLLRTLVDRPTSFEENIFYDVSAWSLPLAYDLDEWALGRVPSGGVATSQITWGRGELSAKEKVVAYAMRWSPEDAAKDLWQMLRADLRVKVATQPFVAQVGKAQENFDAGTIVIPIGIQDASADRIVDLLSKRCETTWYPITSGLTPEGIDLGSGGFSSLEKPEVLLAVGDGVSRYDAGTLWHWCDTHLEMPITMADAATMASVDWWDYNVVVLAGGQPRNLSSSAIEGLKRWISDGGTLVCVGTANEWAAGQQLVTLATPAPTASEVGTSKGEADVQNGIKQLPYAQASNDRALELLSGVILEGKIDVTHPLGWGQADTLLPVFRNHRTFLKPATSPYANPVVYAENPLMAGYASTKNLERVKSSVSVAVHGRGSGRVIAIAEMPCFRGFFRGSARLFNNAIFFGPVIQNR